MSEMNTAEMLEVPTSSSGTPVKQFSLMLSNRVGALASIVKLLQQNNISVLGLSVQDSCDATIVRLLVSNPELTECVFIEKGIAHMTCEMIIVAVTDVAVNLLKILEILMAAETNLDFSYPLLLTYQGCSLLALHVDDDEFAASVLSSAGMKLLSQEDLT